MIPVAMWTPSIGELLVVLVIVLVLFGAGKLPDAFKAMGKAVKSFRDAQKDESIDVTPPRRIEKAEEAESIEQAKEKAEER